MGGRRNRTVATASLAALVLAAAVSLPACARSEAPSTVHAGGVSADTYAAIVTAMKANGIKVTSESSLRMTYAGDKDHVTVTGGGMRSVPSGGGAEASVASVQMRRVAGKWQVASISGRY